MFNFKRVLMTRTNTHLLSKLHHKEEEKTSFETLFIYILLIILSPLQTIVFSCLVPPLTEIGILEPWRYP